MPDQLQLRGGTTTEHATFTGASKEVTIDTTKKTAVVHDGSVAGGNPLMREDGANSALIDGSATEPALAFAGDSANTGIYSPGTDQLAVSTNGVERVEWGTAEVVFNDGGADYDFRIEGDANANLLFVDASTDRVGIGTNTPGAPLEIRATQSNVRLVSDEGGFCQLQFGDTVDNIRGGLVFDCTNNRLQLRSHNNETAVTINSSEDVGVGVETPDSKLHVVNGSDSALILKVNGADTTTEYIGFGVEAGEGILVAGGAGSTSNSLVFKTSSSGTESEAARFDSSGRLLVGVSTTNVAGATIQSVGTHPLWLHRGEDNTSGPNLNLSKSRNTAYGSNTIVQNGDTLGTIQFRGDDGTDFVTPGAYIQAFVDGTPGENDMPGRLVFSTTADGASSPTERMRITSTGQLNLTTSQGTAGFPTFLIDNTNTGGYAGRIVFGSNHSGTAFNAAEIQAYGGSSTTDGSLAFETGGSESARIDSSGRLLIGTTSSSVLGNAHFTGQAGNNTYSGLISITRGINSGSVVNNHGLGGIQFGSLDAKVSAFIGSEADAGWGTNDYPGRLIFATTANGASSPTERMRIQNDGRIIAGTTAAFGSGGLTFLPDYSNGAAALYWNRANTATQSTVLVFRNDSTNVGSIYYTNTTTTYATSSDYRLKENVALISDGIDRLKQLKPSRFNFIVDPDKIVDGFIAHEVQDIVPEAIGGTKDEVDDEGNPVYQGIDQSKLVPLLTAALQEAIAKIETLEAKVAALEAN